MILPFLAVIVVFPFFLAVTIPLEDTVAIFLLELAHLNLEPEIFNLASSVVQIYAVTVFPFFNLIAERYPPPVTELAPETF